MRIKNKEQSPKGLYANSSYIFLIWERILNSSYMNELNEMASIRCKI